MFLVFYGKRKWVLRCTDKRGPTLMCAIGCRGLRLLRVSGRVLVQGGRPVLAILLLISCRNEHKAELLQALAVCPRGLRLALAQLCPLRPARPAISMLNRMENGDN